MDEPPLGKKFGRPDLERAGLFSEMPYMNGKGYVSPFLKLAHVKGKSMVPGGPKIKDGTQLAYFDKEFKRLFEGEAIKGRYKTKAPKGQKDISTRPFTPIGPSKKHSTPGDYFGTFEKIDAFSNRRRPKPPFKPSGRNFYTGPGKKGGPGYIDITISRYPEHMSDRHTKKLKEKVFGTILGRPMVNVHFPQPYFDSNPFKEPEGKEPGRTYVPPKEVPKKNIGGVFMPTGPAKWQGGCHGGTFDKFPEHMKCPYVTMFEANKPRKPKEGKLFFPQTTGEISFYTDSIITHNTKFRVNQRTQSDYQPTFIKYLVD